MARLKLKNASSRKRRLRVTQFADWVLGTTREEMQMHVVTQWDTAEKILLARNHYRPDFSGRVAFASASPRPVRGAATAPRFWAATVRRNIRRWTKSISMNAPAPVSIAARPFKCMVDLDPGETTEVIFLLGEADDVEEARHLVRRFRDHEEVERALRQTQKWWDDFLGTLQVETPIIGVNFLLNRWLPYQTLSCRVWGRSAWYQSGGAFGFRDQLQDVMALMHSRPANRARTNFARRRASIRRRRRATLVASAVGCRRAHALHRRFVVAALRRRALHRSNRRYFDFG